VTLLRQVKSIFELHCEAGCLAERSDALTLMTALIPTASLSSTASASRRRPLYGSGSIIFAKSNIEFANISPSAGRPYRAERYGGSEIQKPAARKSRTVSCDTSISEDDPHKSAAQNYFDRGEHFN
jgi:hypothetical protein